MFAEKEKMHTNKIKRFKCYRKLITFHFHINVYYWVWNLNVYTPMAFVEFQCSIIWFMIVSMSNTHVKTTVTLEVAGADGLCQTKQIRVSQQ